MSADQRTVTTDALAVLGTIIDDTVKRDAIHLAVLPVVAGQWLRAGEHIAAKDGVATQAEVGKGHGIVDPFLTKPVEKGQRFLLVIYPRVVTSLRHYWEHPDLPDEGVPAVLPDDIAWLRSFAANVGLKYDILMEGAAEYILTGDYLCFGGLLEGEYVPDEFWTYYERVTGTRVPDDKRGNFFSCSC